MAEPSQSTRKNVNSTSERSTDLKEMSSSRKSGEQKLASARTAFFERKIRRHHDTTTQDRKASCGRFTVANQRVFLFLYSAIFMLRGFTAQYFANIMEHIRKQYTMSQSQVNFLVGTDRIGFAVTILFIAYYGNKLHKPVVIFAGSLLCACACITCFLPHFLERSRTRSHGNQSMDTSAITLFHEAGLCQIGRNSSTSASQCELMDISEHRYMAFSLLATGNFIFGLGTALFATLGYIYIEEAVDQNKSAFYFGIVLCMHSIGEMFGLIAAWQATDKSYDLSGALILADQDVADWWFGFPLGAGLFLLFPIPLVLFPKWIIEPQWLLTRRDRQLNRLLKQLDVEKKLLKKKARAKKRKQQHSNKLKQTASSPEPDTVTSPQHTGDVVVHESDTVTSSQHTNDALKLGPDTVTSSEHTNDAFVLVPETVTSSDHANDEFLLEPHTVMSSEHNKDKIQHNDPVSTVRHAHTNEDSYSSSDENEMNNVETRTYDQDSKQDRTTQSDENHINSESETQSDVGTRSSVGTQPDVICQPNAIHIIDSVRISPEEIVDDMLRAESPDNMQDGANDSVPTNTNPATGKNRRQYLLGRRLQDLPRNVWFLVNRPVYMLTLAANIVAAYSVTGYQPTLYSYMDAIFPGANPPHFAVSGMVYTLATALAVLVAGCVMYGRPLSIVMHVKLLMLLQAISVLLYLVMMIPLCQNEDFFHMTPTETLPPLIRNCNLRCDCSDVVYNPVCSGDDVLFVTPCHAGCRDITVSQSGNNLIYSRCTCAPEAKLSRTQCNACRSQKAGYNVLVFLATFAQSLGFVSFLQIYLRCISAKMRSLGLGFAVWIIHLTATVPGYAAYTALQNTSCLEPRSSCDQEGICWQFDLTTLGYSQNGTTAALQFVSLVILLVLYLVLRKRLQSAQSGAAGTEAIKTHTTLESTNSDTSRA